jgi:hypothetical protein
MMLFTAVVLVLMIVGLVREVASPAAILLGALAVLVLGGALSTDLAFAGLASPATISIAGLFVVARAVRDHYVGFMRGAALDRSTRRLSLDISELREAQTNSSPRVHQRDQEVRSRGIRPTEQIR